MVISTFRLLSPSKGIEHMIPAMPTVRRRVGDVVYLIAGRTHPEVVRGQGEDYRRALEALTHSLGVDEVVRFRDWFHDVDQLSALLHATDVFATPYSDADQIVSGALSFALAAGVPFVSTSYRYAVGLASQGCGLTVPFDDDEALADALSQVLTDNELRASARSHGEAHVHALLAESGRVRSQARQQPPGLTFRQRRDGRIWANYGGGLRAGRKLARRLQTSKSGSSEAEMTGENVWRVTATMVPVVKSRAPVTRNGDAGCQPIKIEPRSGPTN